MLFHHFVDNLSSTNAEYKYLDLDQSLFDVAENKSALLNDFNYPENFLDDKIVNKFNFLISIL